MKKTRCDSSEYSNERLNKKQDIRIEDEIKNKRRERSRSYERKY